MKLYATVTSERGKSVGKGGNNHVEILLQVDPLRRIHVGRVVMEAVEGGYKIAYYPACGASLRATNDDEEVILLDTNGN